MSKEKQVMIPEKLMCYLLRYFLVQKSEADEQAIIESLNDKMDAMINHQIYTEYKTAPTEEQREKARQEYLERVGILKDFRW